MKRIKINKNSLVLKSKDKFIEDIKDILKIEINFPIDGLFKNLKVKEDQKDLVVQFNLNDKLEEERKLKVIEEFKTLLLDVFLELMENQQWTKSDNLWRLNFRIKEKIKGIYFDKFSDFNRERDKRLYSLLFYIIIKIIQHLEQQLIFHS